MAISIDKIEGRKKIRKNDSNGNFDLSKLLSTEIKLFQKLSLKDKLAFYQELDLLLGAGLDLENSLILIQNQSKEKSKKKLLAHELIEDIIDGKSMSAAMQDSKKFSEYEFFSIQIGEETGKLNQVIESLKEYYSNVIEQKKKLTSALSYPIIVMTVAVLAVFFLLNFVVPLFEDVFKRFDEELPFLTEFIISWSKNLGVIIPWMMVVLATLFAIYFFNRKKDSVRKFTSGILLKIPIVGDLAKKLYLTRTFNSLHLLVSSKNPLLNSIEMVRKMIRFYPLELSLKNIEEDVLKGSSLNESLAKHSFFNPQIVTLIKVGEEVGHLELVLDKVRQNMEEELSHKMNTIGSLLEPILIVAVGGIVALILVAMYLPLFDLSTSIM